MGSALVWFRDDLRAADNPALSAAVATGRPVACAYVLHDGAGGGRPLGGASRWWLHHALEDLARDLAALGSHLVLRRGDPAEVVPALAKDAGADAVFWNRRYAPEQTKADAALKAALAADGVAVKSFNGSLLHEPWEVATGEGGSFKVFSPFWRAARAKGEPRRVLASPKAVQAGGSPASDDLKSWSLLPTAPDWSAGLAKAWTPGAAGARDAMERFLDHGIGGYAEGRDRPDREKVSRLSPYLRFGCISPVQVWHAVRHAESDGRAQARDVDKFLTEIGWREFSYHLLHTMDDIRIHNVQRRFDAFPWRSDRTAVRAWTKGLTGYPIVDAGMRQLWQTGWMHNRVRMIAASFLIKDLLIDWREGEDWFWDTLVDADPASNPASWQWVAGSGADAAPYFRVFNPVLQGEKFDPDGHYVRAFVPELAGLPAACIHQPWAAPAAELSKAGVVLGKTYPRPIIDHGEARDRALSALQSLKAPA